MKKYFDDLYSGDWLSQSDFSQERLKKAVDISPFGKKVLDIGCADGSYLSFYKEKYPESQIYGTEISSVAVSLAEKRCPTGVFICTDKLPFEDKMFDFIHAAEILECLPNPEPFLQEIKRILSKGGKFLVTTAEPNYEYHTWEWKNGKRLNNISRFSQSQLPFEVIAEYPAFWHGRIRYVLCA